MAKASINTGEDAQPVHTRTTAGTEESQAIVVGIDGSDSVVPATVANGLLADVSRVQGNVAVTAASLPLPTGASTEATLSAINTKLAGTIAVSNASLPLPTGAATETTLAAVNSKLAGTIAVSGTFWQATQPVSGTFWPTTAAAPASHRLSDGATFYDAAKTGQLPTALVGGRLDVNIGASGATVPVSGTFWQATQPVSGTFWQATQPISAASLPLPTGAAAEHTTAASPHSTRLSDGAAFYDATKTGQLPSALVGGRLDVNIGAVGVTPLVVSNQETLTDNAGFTDGTSKLFPQGFIFDETAGTALTENDVAAGRIDSKRAIVNVLEDATTRGQRMGVLASGAAKNDVTSVGGTAPAALADGTANPTTVMFSSPMMYFNGTTWDRARGNYDTTTGDTGTKTTTFAGATQTNYNAVGALILVKLGTVSGTSPTLSCQLQWSYDGGTNFLNVGPALTNLTATNNTGLIIVYPANTSQTAGATPANMTSGATATMSLNFSLPRTWRINYTIGGTTPSFALTAVYVNYIL